MRIVLNGNPQTVSDGLTVSQLLEWLAIPAKGVAIAVNEEIVPAGQWGERLLEDGDAIELVTVMQGG